MWPWDTKGGLRLQHPPAQGPLAAPRTPPFSEHGRKTAGGSEADADPHLWGVIRSLKDTNITKNAVGKRRTASSRAMLQPPSPSPAPYEAARGCSDKAQDSTKRWLFVALGTWLLLCPSQLPCSPAGAPGGTLLAAGAESSPFAQSAVINQWGVEVCSGLFSFLSPALPARALNQRHMTSGSFSHQSSPADCVISQRHGAARLLLRCPPSSQGLCG